MISIDKSLYEHFKNYANNYADERFIFDEERSGKHI